MRYALILIAVFTVFAADFDLSKLDVENLYTYRLSGDGDRYTVERSLELTGDQITLSTLKKGDDGSTMRIEGRMKLDGSPIYSKSVDSNGNVVCSATYDYDREKVYFDKEGKKKTISLKENPLDGMTMEIAIGGMQVSRYECNGYSCERQGSAGMVVEKKGTETISVPAGTFTTVKTEHTFDGLLSLVIPTITYWHDIESGHCVRLKVGDTLKELVKVEKK